MPPRATATTRAARGPALCKATNLRKLELKDVVALTKHGDLYYTRYTQNHRLEDITGAIACYTRIISGVPDGYPLKPDRLFKLGTYLALRFGHQGELSDLDTAIDHLNQAVLLAPEAHPCLIPSLGHLGTSYQIRFERLEEPADAEIGIECLNRAMSLAPEGYLDKPRLLLVLGGLYESRFKLTRDLGYMDRAIGCLHHALSLTSNNHPVKKMALGCLGGLHGLRFENLGEMIDLKKSIEYLRQAVSHTPEGDPAMPNQLNNLGLAYVCRHQRLGELADLDAAIDWLNQAVSLTPRGHSDVLTRLGNLGLAYTVRFEGHRELVDLDRAIECGTQAISLAPVGHPGKPTLLNNLGLSYRKRFQYLKQLADLHKAIKCSSQSVSLTTRGHPDMPARLDNLGLSYQSRFDCLGVLMDSNWGIIYKAEAILLTPEGHPDQRNFLNSLGTALQRRFRRTNAIEDLDLAIGCLKRAVSLTPEGHVDKPVWLSNLSDALYAWFCRFGHPNDLRSSLDCAETAAQASVGPSWARFDAALKWARRADTNNHSASLGAYQQLINLIPERVWLGNGTDHRYKLIAESVGDVAIEAAAVAIKFQRFDLALEWLEEGRSIVWNQMFQVRTPLDQLSSVDASLAERLKEVAQELEQVSSSRSSTLEPKSNQLLLEQTAQWHHRLAEKRKRLIEAARRLPGMHGFMRPKKASSLAAAARTGAVVVVNVHQSGCHALIIQPLHINVDCIPLTSFTHEKASHARTKLARSLQAQGRTDRGVTNKPKANDKSEMEELLKMLWIGVAKPVLEFLGYMTMNNSYEYLPHITWCTTGPLSFLPLHAAGDYNTPDQSLFRYAVSSFTPNLSTLLTRSADPPAFSGILAISQACTPGLQSLPGTVAELNHIAKQAGSARFTRLDGREATCSAVLAAMDEHSWTHFACHASQNTTKPTASAFHLHDGPLDLAAIMRKQLKQADLAFLSACQTAKGDKELSEEAVHLAAGMIMAGYRTVIATMWSINDGDAPIVAERFYAYMLDGEAPNEQKAAKALHNAVGYLRDRIGVKQFERWAPYVHLGV
ncbi:hypothetical protein FS749_002040 [Ceratobasidium sp. UAMH 11750]|nr:hypothetical protein FS749_002040 [Ceratobasidium sp. UAMH 11750]